MLVDFSGLQLVVQREDTFPKYLFIHCRLSANATASLTAQIAAWQTIRSNCLGNT